MSSTRLKASAAMQFSIALSGVALMGSTAWLYKRAKFLVGAAAGMETK